MANSLSHRSSAAAGLLRACALLLVLLAAPSAQAAAPWCDALAQTIAAPPPIVAQNQGEIRGWECSDPDQNAVQQSPAPPDRRPQVVNPPSSEKAVGQLLSWPPPQAARKLPRPESERHARPGHSDAVYRPPRP